MPTRSIRDELRTRSPSWTLFHVVKLATQVVDGVRRRVQQNTLGHRSHEEDPLYKIRGLLRRGAEHLADKQTTKLNTCLAAGDPDWEVTLAWHCYQQLHSMYQATDLANGRDRRTGHHRVRVLPDTRLIPDEGVVGV